MTEQIKARNVAAFINEHGGFDAKATTDGKVQIDTTTAMADPADGWAIVSEFATMEIEPSFKVARWLLGY